MKFQSLFNKTAFYMAVEMKNIDIVKLLLTNDKLNVNIPLISLYMLIKF